MPIPPWGMQPISVRACLGSSVPAARFPTAREPSISWCNTGLRRHTYIHGERSWSPLGRIRWRSPAIFADVCARRRTASGAWRVRGPRTAARWQSHRGMAPVVSRSSPNPETGAESRELGQPHARSCRRLPWSNSGAQERQAMMMRRDRALRAVSLCLVIVLIGWAPAASAESFSHAALDTVLRAHLHNGRVDYGGLARDSGPLERYLAAAAQARPNAWPRDEQLAFWVNVYNARVLDDVIRHPKL